MRTQSGTWFGAAALAALVACGGGRPAPSETPPSPPSSDDPAFSISGLRSWYLIGDGVTAGRDELTISVEAPPDVGFVDLWLGDRPGIRLEAAGTEHRGQVPIGDLPAGEHELLLAADGAGVAFARRTVYRSHPLYVIVTNDWDDPDNSEKALDLQEYMHEEHPHLVMTHFVGPYTFTDPSLSEERVQYLVDWVEGMRDTHGDEIGLHIHPYCNFVEAAGVDCRTEPSLVYEDGDPSGYTVPCWSYTEEEFTQLLTKADELFEEHGLGKPTSFRAGAWAADLSVLRALAASGYVADTSANNWSRMEEWEGVQNGQLYDWNRMQWATIDDTSQPYYPSEDDILDDAAPTLPILEIPDNGILVDYVTGQEMIDIFEANWSGGALEEPIAYSIGYHPSNFDNRYYLRLDDAFIHIEKYLAAEDRGPVVYGLMSDMPKVWTRDE